MVLYSHGVVAWGMKSPDMSRELREVYEEGPSEIYFIAIVKHQFKNKILDPTIEDSCARDSHTYERYKEFARMAIKKAPKWGYHDHFRNHLGKWFIKGFKNRSYLIVTSNNYPNQIAIRALDELNDNYRESKAKQIHKDIQNRRAECPSKKILKKYGIIVNEAISDALDREDARLDEYARKLTSLLDNYAQIHEQKKIKKVQDQVAACKDQVSKNLDSAFELQKDVVLLEAKSKQALEMAKVFEKRVKVKKEESFESEERGVNAKAKEIDPVFIQEDIGHEMLRLERLAEEVAEMAEALTYEKTSVPSDEQHIMEVTKACAIIGGLTGFIIAGPAGAGLGALKAHIVSQIVETGLGATVFGSLGYLGAKSASRYLNQKFYPL